MGDKERKEKRLSALTRWDPFGDLDLFEAWDPFRERGLLPSRLARLFESRLGWPRESEVIPALDIAEDEKRFVVTVELPGMKKGDVSVETRDNVMTIRGEKKSEREEKKENRRWVERSFGSFSRSFTLPANAAAERVDASFKDGILTIAIPKTEESKPKVVAIKAD